MDDHEIGVYYDYDEYGEPTFAENDFETIHLYAYENPFYNVKIFFENGDELYFEEEDVGRRRIPMLCMEYRAYKREMEHTTP